VSVSVCVRDANWASRVLMGRMGLRLVGLRRGEWPKCWFPSFFHFPFIFSFLFHLNSYFEFNSKLRFKTLICTNKYPTLSEFIYLLSLSRKIMLLNMKCTYT
jgi:hypothetical protein